jgi:hypothetical protein
LPSISSYGTAESVTSLPPSPILPSACDNTSVGTGGPVQEEELVNCFAAISGGPNECDWFTDP